MTLTELINKLRTDPIFLTEVIVFNNPNAVLDKLERLADFVDAEDIETPEQLLNIVKQLINEGEMDTVNEILAVPFDEAAATDQLKAAYKQLVKERGQTTVDGRFLDTQGGLLLLAKSAPTQNNQPSKPKETSCGCNGKVITLTKKHIIIGIVVLVITFLLLKKYNK